ncbi:MAG: homoserine O-succinyltransferase [Mariniphaga sp.]|nr:homoserine O-succinyltransferase [Mariniphaga sp.]MDD4424799.1 homoserine O-succinyltransferase [Mariniphaga sp.]
MPVNVPDKLPAIKILEEENIFVMDETRALHQDIRPLKIIILNLMPLKVSTETDLLRLLSNSPLQIEIDFMKMSGYTPKNTPAEHMKQFYRSFDELRGKKYDGLIITGAPVELLPFEKVTYWSEFKEVLNWADTHVYSSLFICWAAQAGLFHYYNIPKYELPQKLFGVFEHTHADMHLPILRGFDDRFFMPHSRYTEVRAADVEKVKELQVIAHSEDAGVAMVKAKNGRQLFLTGHLEYSRFTLDKEYKRDRRKKIPIQIPQNYYPGNDSSGTPCMRWGSAANLLFANWLNYYVYQETPYNLEEIS